MPLQAQPLAAPNKMLRHTILLPLLVSLATGEGLSTSYGPPSPAYSPPAPPAPAPAPPPQLEVRFALPRVIYPIPVVPFPSARAPSDAAVDLGTALISHFIGKVLHVLSPAAALIRAVPAAITTKLLTPLSYAPAPILGPAPAFSPAPLFAPPPAAEYGTPTV